MLHSSVRASLVNFTEESHARKIQILGDRKVEPSARDH